MLAAGPWRTGCVGGGAKMNNNEQQVQLHENENEEAVQLHEIALQRLLRIARLRR